MIVDDIKEKSFDYTVLFFLTLLDFSSRSCIRSRRHKIRSRSTVKTLPLDQKSQPTQQLVPTDGKSSRALLETRARLNCQKLRVVKFVSLNRQLSITPWVIPNPHGCVALRDTTNDSDNFKLSGQLAF